MKRNLIFDTQLTLQVIPNKSQKLNTWNLNHKSMRERGREREREREGGVEQNDAINSFLSK